MELKPEHLENIRASLKDIRDPETGRGIGGAKQIHSIEIVDGKAKVTVGLTTFCWALKDDFETQINEAIKAKCSDLPFEVEIVEHQRPAQPKGQVGLTAKAVIAVGSGKGGVGKSTSAICLALDLGNSSR